MVLQVLNVIAGLVALEWGKAFSTVIGLVIEGYFFVCVWSFRSEEESLIDFLKFVFQKAAAGGRGCAATQGLSTKIYGCIMEIIILTNHGTHVLPHIGTFFGNINIVTFIFQHSVEINCILL